MENKYEHKIITIPNLLSMFRLVLVPVIWWLYCVKEDYLMTLIVLFLSGVTDVVDGFIARKFQMISNFGKALDPVADKITQAVMLFCLASRYPYMWILFGVMVVKEVFMGITGLVIMRKKNAVYGAAWHGKLTTVSLYGIMLIHLIWFHIPQMVSNGLILLCLCIMLMSFGIYGVRNIKMMK